MFQITEDFDFKTYYFQGILYLLNGLLAQIFKPNAYEPLFI